jgi:hypothetical protein
MTNKKIISLKHSELVELVESIVMDIKEQTGDAGEMKQINLDDSSWDELWYGTRDVLTYLSMVSIIPTPWTRAIGIIAGVLAGAMYMEDDEWGTGVAFWIFEAIPYIKVTSKLKALFGATTKALKLKPREVKKIMEGLASGTVATTKLKGANEIIGILARYGDEIVEAYQTAIKSSGYKKVFKISKEVTDYKTFKAYTKNGKYAKELTEIGWDDWNKLSNIIRATGPLELRGFQLLVNRAKMLSTSVVGGVLSFSLAMFSQTLIDISRAKYLINNTDNPWESVKQGKRVYYDYNTIMTNHLWNENPVLLIKAWKDKEKFPQVTYSPVDVSIDMRTEWHGDEDNPYSYKNDDFGSCMGLNCFNTHDKEGKPINRIMYANAPGGWRPELEILNPKVYDLKLQYDWFSEQQEIMSSIFKAVESGELTKEEAKTELEDKLNMKIP